MTRLSLDPTWLEAVHGRLPCGVMVFDESLALVYANRAWSHTPADVTLQSTTPPLGATLRRLFPDADSVYRAAEACLTAGIHARLPNIALVDGGGNRVWDISLAPIIDTGQVIGLICVGDDATARVAAERVEDTELQAMLEQRLAERTQSLSLLLDVSRNITSMLELKPLLGLILDEVRSAVEYEGAGILTLEDDELVQAAQRGPDLNGLSAALRLPVARSSLMRGLLLGTEPLVIPDVWSESASAGGYRQAVTEEWLRARPYVRSWIGVPLRMRERTLGLLVITHGEAHHFTDHQVRVLKAVAAQAAVAIENARLMAGAREAAASEERQRLARELHDAVTQTLFSASLIGDVLPALWIRDRQRGEQALQDLQVLTRGALAEMRTLLFELRPNALAEVPFGDLLRHLADAITGRARVPITVGAESIIALPPDVQIALYRIAQEALNNVAKHAAATQVEVRLRRGPGDRLVLSITENGRGFDPAQPTGGHFGLQTMHERASMIGAHLTVTSAPGQGTGIVVIWPAPDQADTGES